MTQYRATDQGITLNPYRKSISGESFAECLAYVSMWIDEYPQLNVYPCADAGSLLRVHLLEPETNKVARLITITEEN